MQKYKQLDLKGRHKIKALLEAGHSQTKIAEIIRVHKSTISRELTRNVPTCSGYANEYSPELISGRWNVMGVDGVSHEAIYQWIWRGKHQNDLATKKLYTHLKHGRRRRKRGNYNDSRGSLTGRVSIEQRPEVVEERSRLRDLEVDLMVGKAHKSALVVIIDRATLLTRHADTTELAIEQCLARIPKAFIKTYPSIMTRPSQTINRWGEHLMLTCTLPGPTPLRIKGPLKTELEWSGSSFQRVPTYEMYPINIFKRSSVISIIDLYENLVTFHPVNKP